LLDEGHCLAAQALEVCRQVGAATDHPARAASLTTIAQLVAAGLGATLLPATALPVETRKGKLAVAQFRAPAPGRQVGLVFRAGSGRPGDYYQLAEYLHRGLDRPGFAGRLEGTDHPPWAAQSP
jgi:LysR family hydrogen peroxide-inducible transcriptional activator